LYLFYVDECGRPSLEDKSLADDPWFVMAGVAIRSDQWLLIDTAISTLKRDYFPRIRPIDVEFKSTNIRSYGGPFPRDPFSSLSPEQMRALTEALYALYEEYALPLFTVTINRAEHKKRYTSQGKRPEHPYQLAFKMLVERFDWFLEHLNEGRSVSESEFGFVILDEYVGQYKITRSNLVWYQGSGTFAKPAIDFIKEVPFFNVSRYSQMLTLPDLVAYNVYHRFRYDKPNYPFYRRIMPRLYRESGKLWGYGLKVFPERKALPEEL
jgi:hypothetical protein